MTLVRAWTGRLGRARFALKGPQAEYSYLEDIDSRDSKEKQMHDCPERSFRAIVHDNKSE